MFLLCYLTDLPRVKEKRWWHSGILYGVTNVQIIIPSDKRIYIKTITCKSSQNGQCQCTKQKHCKMDFCYVLFIYLIFNFAKQNTNLQNYVHKIIRE